MNIANKLYNLGECLTKRSKLIMETVSRKNFIDQDIHSVKNKHGEFLRLMEKSIEISRQELRKEKDKILKFMDESGKCFDFDRDIKEPDLDFISLAYFEYINRTKNK